MRLPSEVVTACCLGPLFALLMAGCGKERTGSGFVARVNQSYLTKEEIEKAHDSLASTRTMMRAYVDTWVTNEVLYQEAQRRGFGNSEELQHQLEETRKRLAISALLEAEVYNEQPEQVGEEEIAATLKTRGGEFLLREDLVQVSFALFSDRDAANGFRTMILRGSSWNDAVLQMHEDSLFKRQILQVADHEYFTKSTLYPEELWKLSRNLPKEEVSFVVKTDFGYYVLIVHNTKKQGELPDLAYVHNEILERILLERRKAKYERMLAGLREKYSIEVRLSGADSAEVVSR